MLGMPKQSIMSFDFLDTFEILHFSTNSEVFLLLKVSQSIAGKFFNFRTTNMLLFSMNAMKLMNIHSCS